MINGSLCRLRPVAALALAGTALICGTTQAADIDVRNIESPLAAVARALDPQSFADLNIGESITLRGLPVGDQRMDIELERFSIWTDDAEFFIGDVAQEKPDIVLLRGSVAGDENSLAVLGIGRFATNGFIETNGKTFVVSTGKFDGPATPEDIRIADLTDIKFQQTGPGCGINEENAQTYAPFGLPVPPSPTQDYENRGTTPCRVARIAIDTDWEWTAGTFGGNANASAEYALFLTAAVSEIYQRDVNVRLVVPFLRTFSSNNDPYTGTIEPDPLDQLLDHWSNNMGHVDRELTHLLTGTSTWYGGIAYLSVVCSYDYGYAVSAYLGGFFPYPTLMNSNSNWDLMVVSHELGHNFGTLHTHDGYEPPIDNCGIDCSGSVNGTIMSYCHICSGGLMNVDMRFHPLVQAVIEDYLQYDAPCNLEPGAVAGDDSAATDAGVSVDIFVLANDSGPDCAPVGIASVESPTPGGATVTIAGWDNPTGDPTGRYLEYTPPANLNGIDTFTYTTTAGQTGTVNVDVNGPPNCGPADIAEPFGILDLADVNAFALGFQIQWPSTDIAEPFGVWDLNDINVFIASFLSGCP